MKKRNVIVFLGCLLLMSVTVSAQDITVDPSTISIDLVAGDTVYQNITVRFTCDNPSILNITTYILPDDDGIIVTYMDIPENPVKNTDYIIQMVIHTNMTLAPGVYTLYTNFNYACGESEVNGGKKTTSESHWYPSDYLPDYKPPVTPDDTAPTEPDDFVNVLYYKMSGENGQFPLLGILIIILLIITLLCIVKRRMAKKPGEK